MTAETKINAIAPWYGSNRTLRRHVGRELRGWKFVAVPFAGGMTELLEIEARSIVVNDLHRHVINLARVIRRDRQALADRLNAQLFDPDTLAAAQDICRRHNDTASAGLFGPSDSAPDDPITWAAAYHYCVWCSRNGIAGTPGEFDGGPCYRFDDGGGDPVTRYRGAVASLDAFGRVFERCAFRVGCGIELCRRIAESRRKAKSKAKAAIYSDCPFPGPGDKYTHAFTDQQHRDLAEALNAAPPESCRVVARFYDHDWVRALYPADRWTWLRLDGGKDQQHADKPEVLLINGPSYAEQ